MLPSPDSVPPYWEVKPITSTDVKLYWINPSLRPTEVSNYTVRIFLLRKLTGKTSQYISLQLNRPFELPREVSDEGRTLETSAFLSFYVGI